MRKRGRGIYIERERDGERWREREMEREMEREKEFRLLMAHVTYWRHL